MWGWTGGGGGLGLSPPAPLPPPPTPLSPSSLLERCALRARKISPFSPPSLFSSPLPPPAPSSPSSRPSSPSPSSPPPAPSSSPPSYPVHPSSMQYNCIYGPSCPVRTGRVVRYGPSCPWAELSTGRVVRLPNRNGQSNALAFSIDRNANFPDFNLVFHPSQYLLRQLVIYQRLRLHLSSLKITVW